jgi:hypothetical protein
LPVLIRFIRGYPKSRSTAVEDCGREFAAWVAALRSAGVELPRPDRVGWIYVPSEWPPDEREREDALRDEAAEIMGVEG